MSSSIRVGEAADTSFLIIDQPANSNLRYVAIKRLADLIHHDGTMAKRPCECRANCDLQSVVHARNHQPESRTDVSAGLADLERLEEPLVDCFGTSDPEMTAAAVRLLLTHLNWNSKQLLGAMVLDRLGADLLSRAQELVTFLSRHL